MILARKTQRENIRTFVCDGYESKRALVRQPTANARAKVTTAAQNQDSHLSTVKNKKG